MRASWEKWPAVVCRDLFCFRPLAYHVILARAQVLSMRTLREQCDKCDSACSVDFHRKFKQTTISQNLLIKSWRQLPKILFMSPFRQWKPQNKFLNKVVLWHNQVSREIYFPKTLKTVCYNLVKLFKRMRLSNCKLCSNSWRNLLTGFCVNQINLKF